MRLKFWPALAVCVAVLSLPPAAGAAPSCASTTWVGSWMAAPSDSVDRPLSDQTIRMIVSPHLGGGRVRVHLTNRFGDAPLNIAHATIGDAAAGGGVVAGTLRELTFSGSKKVTLPAGRDIVSDPAASTVLPFRKLAVSIAVRGIVDKPTEHFDTREINYSTGAGSGDHTTDSSGGAFTSSGATGNSTGWYLLEGVDVPASGHTGSVVTFGDSITDGFQGRGSPVTEDFATIAKEERYPDYLQRRLDAAHTPLSVLNAGISGNRILQDGQIPLFGHKALDRLDADAIHQAGVRDVIILEGINDIGQAQPGGVTAQQLIDGYKRLIARLHAAHLRVLLGTLTPSGGTIIPTYGMTANQIRVPVNQWIRTQKRADAVIDFDAAVRDPSDPSRILPNYDGSDHLHFSAAGYQVLANAIPLNQLSTPTCRQALSLRISTPQLTTGKATTIRILVRQNLRPVAHARVQLGHTVVHTNARGVARLRVKFNKPGLYKLIVTAKGATTTVVAIRVRKRSKAH